MDLRRILITGGAGFVGSSLALRFRTEWPSAEVICLDNLYRKGSDLNRRRVEEAGCRFVRGDVRRREDLELPACDLLVDAAAEPSVLAGTTSDPAYVVDTNLVGTLNLLERARTWQARLLFLSTSRVYPVQHLRSIALETGQTRLCLSARQQLPGVSQSGISESFPMDGSRTLYGATKYASEIMVAEYAAQFGIRTLVNRCGVLAGPWQMGRVDQGVVALWTGAHVYGRPLTYIGYEGKQVRDLLHVEDVADLVLRQVKDKTAWDGRVYNVGGGTAISVSLRELTQLAETATGNRIEIREDPAVREGDVPLYITDAAAVMKAFEWSPQRDVEAIVRDTADWLLANKETLHPVFCG